MTELSFLGELSLLYNEYYVILTDAGLFHRYFIFTCKHFLNFY